MSSYDIRTASIYDVELMDVLFNSPTARFFGEKSEPPLSLLFQRYQSHRLLVYERTNPDDILSYCEFCVYPNIPVLANDFWPDWLKCRFCIDMPLTLMNTMFFNFFIYYNEHPNILKQVILELFYREHKINFLVVARPPNCDGTTYNDLEQFGKIYYPIAFDIFGGRNLPTIVIITRVNVMPSLSFRIALPEDNDDVVEMIDAEDPSKRRELGDYFIAEMLMGTAGDSMVGDKVIVTEEASTRSDGSTGMMWLSESVDLIDLITKFDLEGMGNLVKCTPGMSHATIKVPVRTTEQDLNFKLDMNVLREMGADVILRRQAGIRLKRQDLRFVFARFKYIHTQYRTRINYLTMVSKTLEIPFDAPRRSSVMNKKTRLENAANVFFLKSLIMHPSLRIEYIFYYLSAMFSAYPDRDYCILKIMPGLKYSSAMLGLLQFFIRVRHRPCVEYVPDLFIVHRCSVNTELMIYKIEETDVEAVLDLTREQSTQGRNSWSRESILSDQDSPNKLTETLSMICSDVLQNNKSEFKAWMIRCGHSGKDNTSIVGVAVLRSFSDYAAVYKRFILHIDEDYMTFDRGELVLLLLHPNFHMWSDDILRMLAIRSGYREIYYFQSQNAGSTLPNDLAPRMMPVEPRRMVRNWFIDTNSESCYRRSSTKVELFKINCIMDQFYLYRHNLLQTKFFGNQSPIIIVGLSDICLAFLRLMIFGFNTNDSKYIGMNNCLPMLDITVLAKCGEAEAEYDPTIECDYCIRKDECYLNNKNSCPFVMDTTHRLDMRNWIHFIGGYLTEINREKKFILLDNGCRFYYDKLLLLADTKFGRTESPDDENPFEESTMPFNYAHLNSRLDKIALYHKVVELNKRPLRSKYVILYGYSLAVYECIDFLLKHGCLPEHIRYVQPHLTSEPEYINNPTVDLKLDRILIQILLDLGIRVYESHNYHSTKMYESDYFIEAINFKSVPSGKKLTLNCDLFINFTRKDFPLALERVLCKSGILVEDHKIMVNENYCTNDPHIYAAGKYIQMNSQVYHQYIYTNEREMAQKLIDILKLNSAPQITENKFNKPYIFHALLPLNHQIIKITSPKRFMLGLSNDFSRTMTTYNDGDFCRIRLNRKMFVEEIVCVTCQGDKSLFFLEYFCGRHESLLNNLYNRFNMGFIKDFISFLQEPWTELIMHDDFDKMREKNLVTILQNKITTIEKIKTDIGEACTHFMEANLLKFLRKYRKEFVNQFALPEDFETDVDL